MYRIIQLAGSVTYFGALHVFRSDFPMLAKRYSLVAFRPKKTSGASKAAPTAHSPCASSASITVYHSPDLRPPQGTTIPVVHVPRISHRCFLEAKATVA